MENLSKQAEIKDMTQSNDGSAFIESLKEGNDTGKDFIDSLKENNEISNPFKEMLERRTPESGGTWEGEKGNSTWYPDSEKIPEGLILLRDTVW